MATAGAFRFKEGTAPPDNPPAGEQYLYIKSSNHKVYRKDSAGNEVEIGSGGGSGTTISAGSTFPGTPDVGDYYFRTDLGRLFRYNGSAWDTAEVWIEEGAAPAGASGKAVIYMNSADHKLYAIVDNGTPIALDGNAEGTPIKHGTTFPGTADTGDYYFRTDLGRLFCYNGADWDTQAGLWLDETGTVPTGVAGKAVIYASGDHALYAKVNDNTVIPLGITVSVQEQDGTPSVGTLKTLKFPNGALTNEGNGVVSVAFSSPLTVQEVDGSPSVSNVSTIRVANGTLTDDTGGQVTIDTSGSGGTSITAGTAFPGSPTLGDYYFRTDVEGLYRYDGVTWQGVGATNTGWKNLVINGSFAIWQRQSDPATPTTYDDDAYGGADRWYLLSSQANALQTQRIDGSPQRYALRLTQSSATPTHLGLAQIIEGVNCRHLRGQTVTLRMRVRCNAVDKLLKAGVLEWSGTEDDLTASGSHDFVTTWAGTPTLIANMALPPSPAAYDYVTSQADTWHTLVFTATLSTSFTNLVVFLFSADPLAQNDTLDVEAVQLEAGPLPTPFEQRSHALELATCRYYYAHIGGEQAYQQFGTGVARSSTRAYVILSYSAMRVAPSLSVSNTSHFQAYHPGVAGPLVTAMTFNHITSVSCQLEVDYASTGSMGSPIQLRASNTTNARISIDAEL